MFVVFSSIFVADTKIISRHDFVAPFTLLKPNTLKSLIEFVLKYKLFYKQRFFNSVSVLN